MRNRRVGIISILAASAFAASAFTASASAEMVTVFCSGTGAGRAVSLSHQGTTRNVFAGQIMLTLSNSTSGALNGNWMSFCTELSQHIYVNGASQVYQVVSVAQVPNPGPGMGEARANAIARMYTFANNAQFGGNADFAAAFQISVWEISNDYDGSAASLSLAAGNLQGSGLAAGIVSNISSLLAAAADTSIFSKPLVGLGNSGFQDQIVDPSVPIPTPGAMALFGLANLVGARRRRR